MHSLKLAPKLGRYCVESHGRFYNSITHRFINPNDLEIENMLAGQEKDAIIAHIQIRKNCSVMILPSMECNLRCPHCYVGHLLEKPSNNKTGSTDPEKAINFINRVEQLLGKPEDVCIVGGEPLLHPNFFRRCIELRPDLAYSTTTNGIWDFDEIKDILGKMTVVVFSVDGWPDHHNTARKSLNKEVNPFNTTYKNIKKTVSAFPDLDISVQGSITFDNFGSQKDIIQYYALMMMTGLKFEKISLGPCASTFNRNAINRYSSSLPTKVRYGPCCDYNVGKTFVIYQNQIHPSYHFLTKEAPLGTLDDSVEYILEKHKEYALSKMPILHDPVCMNECKAVGICWGLCSSSRHEYKNDKPSSICDRPFKEKNLLELVDSMRDD